MHRAVDGDGGAVDRAVALHHLPVLLYAVLATAISAGGDVTFVVAVQVLRVVVMLLVAPSIARLVGRRTRPPDLT